MVDVRSITSSPGSSAATVRWRFRDQLRLTVVVKATFAFVPDGVMQRADPQPILTAEVHHGNHPARSVRATTDLVPRLPHAEVVLTGHAHPPGGVPAETWPLRLVVMGRREPLLDKSLVVQGAAQERKVPLMLERTSGGIANAENPFGTAEPQIVDPRFPDKPACFAPIGRAWPSRRRRLGRTSRKSLDAPIAEIPDDFDWAYFQAAPEDQQLSAPLRGDEWILLENMHPAHGLLRTRLPGARASAKVFGLAASAAEGTNVVLVCDMVRIDADAERVTLAWRGDIALPNEEAIALADVVAGVALEGERAILPEPGGHPSAARPAQRAPLAAGITTMTLDEGDLEEVDDSAAEAPAAAPPAAAPRAKGPELDGTVVLESTDPSGPPLTRPDVDVTIAFEPGDPGRAAGGPAMPFLPGDPAALARALAVAQPRSPRPIEEPLTEDLPGGALASHLAAPTSPREEPEIRDSLPPDLPPRPANLSQSVTIEVEPERLDASPAPLPFTASPAHPGPDIEPAPRPSAPPQPSGTMVLSEDEQEELGAAAVLPFLTRSARRAEAPEPAAARRSAAPAPTFPRRRREPIPFVTTTPFLPFAIPWQIQAGQDVRTIVVKATFDLVHRGPAVLRAEADLPMGDLHDGGDLSLGLLHASDFAVFKPRADITLQGHAVAPKGGATTMEVRFSFGRKPSGFDRALFVFGDRVWEGAVTRLPSSPAPFKRLPLTFDRAYGGPDFARNPLGKGRQIEPSGAQRLPDLEAPDQLVKRPEDAPEPACFGPVPPRFALRASRLGTYDAKWQSKRWPYFPDDFDWAYFQHAPLAQRVDFPEGDEPYVIAGAHPDLPAIDGRLAGVRPRCFAQKTTEAGGAFFEVLLRLDTVAFEPDENKVSLLWRGVLEVADDRASDVAELFVMEAPVKGAQVDLEAARARFLRERDPLPAVADDPRAPPAQNENARAPSAPGARVQAKLAAAGVGAAGAAAASGAQASAAADPAADPADPQPFVHLDPAVDPLRKEVEARLSANEPLDGLHLERANLTGLDLSSRSLAFVNLKEARLVACRLAGADLGGAQLSGADLTDAILDGADLTGADLTGAVLDGASLRETTLAAAELGAAHAPRADFRGAKGAGARFVQASLRDARFEGASLDSADFTRADLDGAVLAEAKLPAVRLYEARGHKVSFRSATLTEARANGATLVQCNLHLADAKLSIWDEAVLDGTTFLGASLAQASFADASCLKAVFSGADASEGAFQRAKLTGASFLKANLLRASLEDADLEGADLRGANLHAAETWKARMSRAKLDAAIVTGTKLEVKR